MNVRRDLLMIWLILQKDCFAAMTCKLFEGRDMLMSDIDDCSF